MFNAIEFSLAHIQCTLYFIETFLDWEIAKVLPRGFWQYTQISTNVCDNWWSFGSTKMRRERERERGLVQLSFVAHHNRSHQRSPPDSRHRRHISTSLEYTCSWQEWHHFDPIHSFCRSVRNHRWMCRPRSVDRDSLVPYNLKQIKFKGLSLSNDLFSFNAIWCHVLYSDKNELLFEYFTQYYRWGYEWLQ